jgi:Ser/Thr protein kinase RdoA (MazF antagonist)
MLVPDRYGMTFGFAEGCVWDCQAWMPGTPDDGSWPAIRIAAAVEAIAAIHDRLAATKTTGPLPVIARRLAILADADLTPFGDTIAKLVPAAVRRLQTWSDFPGVVHPVVADLRREHVLFEGDHVAGVIDFGSFRVDSPACDLVRLFDDSPSALRSAFEIYERIRPGIDPDLIDVLRDTAPICNLTGCVIRMRSPITDADRPAVELRIQKLIDQCRGYHLPIAST